jgi:tetratricopeptide (TPR) repeat protein
MPAAIVRRAESGDSGAPWALAPKAATRHLLAGRPERALELLQREVAGDPKRAWPYALSAELKRSDRVGKYSEALEDLEKAAALEPESAWIRGYRARALSGAGRTAEAEREIERAAALAPDCAWIRAERARILLSLGRDVPALKEALEACRLAPSSHECRWAAALCLARARDWERALESVDGALSERPSAAAAAVGRGAERPHSLRFEILRSLGRFDEAASVLLAAVEGGERLVWCEDDRAAGAVLPEIDATIRARPKEAWLYFWRGETRMRSGEIRGAEDDFTRALELDPRHAWALAWRAWARMRAGDHAAALADAAAALKAVAGPRKRGSPDPSALEGQLFALRGEIRLSEKSFKPAAADFARAVALEPSAWNHLKRAEALLGCERERDAEADLRAALDLDPDCRPAYVLRAGLRSKRKNLEGALSDLRRAQRPGRGDEGGGLRWARPRVLAAAPPRQRSLGRVCVDPRIELVGLLKLVLEKSPVPDFCARRAPDMAAYVDEARKKLAPFVTPELAARFRATAQARGNAGFPWLGITQMMMDASAAPEMKPLTAAWRDGEDLCLLGHMRKFVAKSRFLEFLDAHEDLFAKWTAPLRRTVENEHYSKTVSAYVGVEIDAYYDLILSPLLRDVGLRAILRGADGARGARTVLCAMTNPETLEAALSPRAEDLLWTGWHEILHLVIDPWSEFYAPEAEEFRRLYAGVPPLVRRKNWMDCFSEHHVRAATQRLLLLKKGPEAQAALAEIDRAEGYRFQDALTPRLADYEADRNKYPALLDFFPEWFKVWRTLQ